jgi:hypothetical protein
MVGEERKLPRLMQPVMPTLAKVRKMARQHCEIA